MRIELNRGLKLTEVLRKYHPDFPPNGLAIFFAVALDEGLSAGDVVERLEIPKATVSRNLRALGDRVSPQKEGMNLIRMEHDAADYRIRRAYLTERGRAFKEEVILALG
ncbi:MarR family transcriptional regulator [Vibrio parahaemolyticus]|uniref:MarR family transcriptional regulator n=1 Tax=Vibrio parahaemolyticus TaxID=670 RepID=UPI00301CDC3A